MAISDTLTTLGLASRVAGHVARERVGPSLRLDTPEAVPASAESLTTQWLTWALCADVPGAEVVDLQVLAGSDGTSSRRPVRVTYNEAGRAAGLPERLFTKATAKLFSRLLIGVTDIAEGETAFYSRVRPGLDLRSPRAFHACFDARSHRSIVLLEDLTVQGWTFPDPMQNPVTRADADDLVDQLAAYHGALWDSPRFGTDLAVLRESLPWQENLNRKVGFERRTNRGVKRAQEVVPEGLFARRAEIYPAFMRSLALHRLSAPTLLHQDLHLGNWLRDADGRMGLYDWQCVARGHWALDYSYALAGTLETDDRRAWQEDLLRRYLDGLAAAGVARPPTFDEAWLAYRQHTLHALAFGAFTLGGSSLEPELQPKDYTVAAIGRISTAVDDLGTLDALA